MTAKDTAGLLLDQAQALVQDRGFNAFSYKNLAESVGIRTASVHYHFPSKEDLGLALMQRYTAQLNELLSSLDTRRISHRAKLGGLIDAYAETEKRGAICLCGSLATDLHTLPSALQSAVATYLDRTTDWVRGILEQGSEAGDFSFQGKPADLAASLIAGLQGALLLSRGSGGVPLVAAVRRSFLTSLRQD